MAEVDRRPAGQLIGNRSLEADSQSVATRNKEFLDSFLEFGIGHYYTLTRLLTERITGTLNEAEKLSIGLEVSALAGAALDNLVTWYYALGKWRPGPNQALLVDLLEATRVDDSHRRAAAKEVTSMKPNEFCHSFGIPWQRGDVRERHIDDISWRYTVDQAMRNTRKALQDLSFPTVETSQAWVARYLNVTKRRLIAVTGSREKIATAVVVSDSNNVAGEDHESELTIPTDPDVLRRAGDLTGNAAIGLFCLLRLFYVTAFGKDPRSPAFVVIWQEMNPASGQGP